MARKHVIIKRLPAIQNLGSIDILCSDKTGTLTSGELELHSSLGFGSEARDAVTKLYRDLNQQGFRSKRERLLRIVSDKSCSSRLLWFQSHWHSVPLRPPALTF